MNVKLVLSQTRPTDGRLDAAFAHIVELLDIAKAARADMILLPELFLPGYNRPDLHATVAQPIDGAWITRLRTMARQGACGITLGWAERAGNAIFNAATTIGADGDIVAHYRKMQLFGAMEHASFEPGTTAPPVFSWAGRRVGLLICYDIEFPQHAAALSQRGADILLVPTANPAGYDHVQAVLVPARAHESALTIAYANYCGDERGLAYGGRSLIVGPDAMSIAAAGRVEATLIADMPERARYPDTAISTQARDYRAPQP